MSLCQHGQEDDLAKINNDGDIRNNISPSRIGVPVRVTARMTFTPDEQDPERLFSQEMNALTVKERDRLYEEVHGIFHDGIDETPEFVKESLEKMREALTNIARRPKKALNRAFFLQPDLAADDAFHLIFLRAERFDPFNAATKMCRYFEHKLELWGEEKLVKRITLEDLGEKEVQHMNQGSVQTAVVNSKGVRAFIFIPNANEDISDWKAYTRYLWYQIMTLVLEDQDVQRRGMVTVSWYGQRSVRQMLDWIVKSIHITKDWPLRINSTHVCLESSVWEQFFRAVYTLGGRHFRLRSRKHFGSDLEVQYSLRSFGIRLPSNIFGNSQGQRNQTSINSYLEERRSIESEFFRQEKQDQVGSVQKPYRYPKVQDVLLGRGQPFRDWPGNRRLASIVAADADGYRSAARLDKRILALKIVVLIQMTGQFIERTDHGWVIVNDMVAKEKINQLFRAHVRDQRAATTLTPSNNDSREQESDDEDDFDVAPGNAKRARRG